jgi:EAL and modified HD-GYP domain-containing signal transduction protein
VYATPVLLSRQPILAHDGRITGHELLFDAGDLPPEQAAAAVLTTGIAERGLAELTGGLPAWIKVTAELLLTVDPLPVTPGSVVLELEAGAAIDDELLGRMLRLRAQGHVIALDDFLPCDELEAALPLANFVKVDLGAYGLAGLSAVVDRLPRQRPRVVATNVGMPGQADSSVRRGADLLQGTFFERPRALAVRETPAGSLDRLRAVVALRGAPQFEEVEKVVAQDPGLTLKVLRLANSAAIGAGRTLKSVREAMVVLGSEHVRQFLLLVLLGQLGEGRPALVASAILRGRLCERLSRELSLGDPDTAFTAGVLSVVDALLDQPMADVLKGLAVGDELRWALLGRSGRVGVVLDMAVRAERNRPGAALAGDTSALADAIGWSDRAISGLS